MVVFLVKSVVCGQFIGDNGTALGNEMLTDGDKGYVIPFNDAAKNGRKVAKLLSEKTGLEVED